MTDETPDWQALDLPQSGCMGPGLPGRFGTKTVLHFLEFDEDWKLYIYEMLPEQSGFSEPFSGEIAGGELGTVETAKKIALRCLMAFQDVDPDLPQAEVGPMMVPGGGRRGGH
jgi:hypothetical protein